MSWTAWRSRVWYPRGRVAWWRQALLSPLWLLSLVWRAGARVDRALRSRHPLRVSARVVSVGNLNVGGAGKTPVVLFLARWAVGQGIRVAILSRGYGRQATTPLALPPGGGSVTAAQAGDEPLLLARGCPEARVYVGRDRAAWARALCAGPDAPQLILLDDGFQHWPLWRDVDLVVVDQAVGLGNGHVLPRGPLREPPSALARATAFWIRTSAEPVPLSLPARPQLRARHQGTQLTKGDETQPLESFVGRPLVAFAGLARPEAFFQSLSSAGLTLVDRVVYPDHHLYRPADLAALSERARKSGAQLVTTQKDSVRLPPGFEHWTLPLEVQLEDAALLHPLLLGGPA